MVAFTFGKIPIWALSIFPIHRTYYTGNVAGAQIAIFKNMRAVI